MFLFLSAQDIDSAEFGLLDAEGHLFSFEKLAVPPEKYLSSMVEFLDRQAVSLDSLKGIVVVSGPGSFTATRLMVTIANTLAFTKQLPIVGVENSARQSGDELIRDFGLIWIKQKADGFVMPIYDRPPHITIKKQN